MGRAVAIERLDGPSAIVPKDDHVIRVAIDERACELVDVPMTVPVDRNCARHAGEIGQIVVEILRERAFAVVHALGREMDHLSLEHACEERKRNQRHDHGQRDERRQLRSDRAQPQPRTRCGVAHTNLRTAKLPWNSNIRIDAVFRCKQPFALGQFGMRLSFLAFVLLASCGGLADLDQDGGVIDAGVDAKPKKDATPDTAPPPYQPVGKKCDAPDASAPLTWTPDDAGVPLHPPLARRPAVRRSRFPSFVPMTFNGDEYRDSVEDFIASVGCTYYWRAIASGTTASMTRDRYGVICRTPPTTHRRQANRGVHSRQDPRQDRAAARAERDALRHLLSAQTDITLDGSHSCQSFGGYHSDFQMSDGTLVPYAVIPRCGTFGQLGDVDAVTAVTSHELIEGSTDPLPFGNPGYQLTEPSEFAWAIAGGGEVADICEFNDDAFFLPSDYPFYVQRSWSNHAAYSGLDPCQPATNTYFVGAPILPDTISYDFGFGSQSAPGIKIAVGESKTIDVRLISSAAWPNTVSVKGIDGAYFFGGKPTLSFALAPSQGNVGDVLSLTVTRTGTNDQFGFEPFMLRATSQGRTHSWWAVVGDP